LGALIRWVLAFGILGAFLMVFSITRELHHRRTMKLKDKTDRPTEPSVPRRQILSLLIPLERKRPVETTPDAYL
jgi:hypothetical protein